MATDSTLTLRAEAKAELECRACKSDCRYFLEEYVRIEDRDNAAVAIPFMLWTGQVKALEAFILQRLVIVLKARQLGLTWLALSYALWRCIFQPGYSVVLLSQKEDDAKELVRRLTFILRHLPRWMVREKSDAEGFAGPVWSATVLTATIEHPNSEPSTFKAMASAPGAGRSFTASLVILDEWAFQEHAREIWAAAFPTINRPTGGQVLGISTMDPGSLFDEMWQGAERGENGFAPAFLSWKSDPRRTGEWYEATKRAAVHSYRREYPASVADAYTVGEGAAFLEWNEDVHAAFDRAWYPPDGWSIIRAYDSGYVTRACCKWYAISPDGWVVCYREYYPQMVTDADQAAEIVTLSKRPDGSAEQIEYTIADPACWQKKSQTGISTADIFQRNRVLLRPANNDRIQGWRVLHEWLKVFDGEDGQPTAMLRFTKSCVNTIRTYPTLKVDDNKPEDVDTDGEDHPADCDRYFAMSRPRIPEKKAAPLTGTYHVGELRLKGYKDHQIRKMMKEGPIKVIGRL
jgi:hypothetical protein